MHYNHRHSYILNVSEVNHKVVATLAQHSFDTSLSESAVSALYVGMHRKQNGHPYNQMIIPEHTCTNKQDLTAQEFFLMILLLK